MVLLQRNYENRRSVRILKVYLLHEIWGPHNRTIVLVIHDVKTTTRHRNARGAENIDAVREYSNLSIHRYAQELGLKKKQYLAYFAKRPKFTPV